LFYRNEKVSMGCGGMDWVNVVWLAIIRRHAACQTFLHASGCLLLLKFWIYVVCPLEGWYRSLKLFAGRYLYSVDS